MESSVIKFELYLFEFDIKLKPISIDKMVNVATLTLQNKSR